MPLYRIIKDVPELGDENIGKLVKGDLSDRFTIDGHDCIAVEAAGGETFSVWGDGERRANRTVGFHPIEWLEEVK